MKSKILSLIFLSFIIFLTCSYSGPTVDEFNDTSMAYHLVVNSEPTGAKVYGVKNNDTATYLGVTPYTFKYIYRNHGNQPRLWGTVTDETIAAGDDILKYVGNSQFVFQCILIKQGYKFQHVYKTLENRERLDPRNTNSSNVFLPGVDTITVEMEPIG